MPDYGGFDPERVPPVCWHLGLLSRVKRIIELAEKDKCLDCIPRSHIIPWAPDGYDSEGTWVLVQFHAETCPTYHNGTKGMEYLNE